MADPLALPTERSAAWPLRAWARVAALAGWLAVALVAHGLWRLVRARSPWPRWFLAGVARISNVRVEVCGTPLRRDVLYLANHISWLDVAVIAGATGSAFVAKAEMAPWPIIGWLATLNNSVYVERNARLDVGAQAAALREALETHQPITLFPEGTTGGGAQLLPFRSSLLAAVAPPPPGIAIQPLAIDYGTDAPAIAWTGDESVGHNALALFSRRRGVRAVLHFLEPLPSTDFPDRKAMSAHARAAIAAALGQG